MEFTAGGERSLRKAVMVPKSFVIILLLVFLTYSMMGWYQVFFAGKVHVDAANSSVCNPGNHVL
jgi:hypothetical protein